MVNDDIFDDDGTDEEDILDDDDLRRWLTHKVLPSIRRTGRYDPEPRTVLGEIEARAKATEVFARESLRRIQELKSRQ